MNVDPEIVAEALLAQLAKTQFVAQTPGTNALAPVQIQGNSTFSRAQRKRRGLATWDQQYLPDLTLLQLGLTSNRSLPGASRWHVHFLAYVKFFCDSTPDVTAETQFNAILLGMDQSLINPMPGERQNLGLPGQVADAYIDGECTMEGGFGTETKCILQVPISVRLGGL